jgi:hypothetical protein
MKIIITEDQLKRVLLKEENNTLYKVKELDIESSGFDHYEGKIILEPGENKKITISVRTFIDKPILFNIVKVSPLITDFKTVNTGKQSAVIRPNGFLDFEFTAPKTKTGTFTAGFTFSYQIVGSSTQVTKSINIPFYREGLEEKLNACKKNMSWKDYYDAREWWEKWLLHPSTKDRFAKTFGYDSKKVEEIFEDYIKKMGQITIQYVDSNKPNPAWAKPAFSQIFINCRIGQPSVLTWIHEIGHILDDVHEFTPGSGIYNFNFLISHYKQETIERVSITSAEESELKKKIISYGFSESQAGHILGNYKRMLNTDIEHLHAKTELVSQLFEVRFELGLKPNEKITVQKLIEKYRPLSSIINTFLSQWLYTGKSLYEFLNYNNSIAMNKSTDTNRNLA